MTTFSLPRSVAGAVFIAILGALPGSAEDDYEREPVLYWKSPAANEITVFRDGLEDGSIHLDASSEKAFLRDILNHLQVPVSSQVLVFSKTSLQRDHISPQTPRALYFSDNVYVGWVPGGDVELAAIDPNLGPVFYLLHRPPTTSATPEIVRRQDCLNCHAGPMTGHVPGFMVRSVFPDANGDPILHAGTHLTGPESAIEERWGGWYVTGLHEPIRHMGNVIARETPMGADLDRESGANLHSLAGRFPLGPYLLDQSDIVALLVLEHQTAVHDRFAQASYLVRAQLHRQDSLRRELHLDETGPSETTRRIIDGEAGKIVRLLLFNDEAKLTSDGVSSRSSFADDFQKNAPHDHEGQALKKFRLSGRIFHNRCSYMIYSRAFDALPAPVIERVGGFLHNALAGPDARGLGTHLAPEEKSRLIQILRETKPTLAKDW